MYQPVSEREPSPSETSTPPPLAPAVETGGAESRAEPQQNVPVAPSRPSAGESSDGSVATVALVQQSDRAMAAGNADEAVAFLERAIRLDPRRAELWLHLAELHLARGDTEAAVQFANKTISLAGERTDWVREAWMVIANARAAQGDTKAADDIRAHWGTYRG